MTAQMTRAFGRRLLAMFLVMMATFGYLAYRSQVNDSHIRANARQICIDSNENATATNTFIDALIAATEKVGAGTPTEVAVRVQSYRDAKQVLTDC